MPPFFPGITLPLPAEKPLEGPRRRYLVVSVEKGTTWPSHGQPVETEWLVTLRPAGQDAPRHVLRLACKAGLPAPYDVAAMVEIDPCLLEEGTSP